MPWNRSAVATRSRNRDAGLVKRTTALISLVLAAAVFLPHSVLAAGNDVRDGKNYFLRYCASCHGLNAAGDGPVAKALLRPPANLRLLGDKYGMPLPAVRLARTIDGRDEISAHGTREMPVWGEKLYEAGEAKRGELGISEIIGKIIAYLNTVQDRRTAGR